MKRSIAVMVVCLSQLALVGHAISQTNLSRLKPISAKQKDQSRILAAQSTSVNEPVFEPVSFEPNVEQLPVLYKGIDTTKLVRWISEKITEMPNIDRFSTERDKIEHAEQIDRLFIHPDGSRLLIPIVINANGSYQPEQRIYTFNIYFSDVPGVTRDKMHEAKLLKINSVGELSGKYSAQNAYGATATVSRGTESEISIGILQRFGRGPQTIVNETLRLKREQFINENDQLMLDIYKKMPLDEMLVSYSFGLAMDPREARLSDKQFRYLFLFKPHGLMNYSSHSAATLGSPYETFLFGKAIIGELDQVWLFNNTTGEVYKKFN